MKSFFKTFLASFLGSALLLLVIIIFLITSLVSSIMSSADTTVEVKPQTVLYMNLDYEIPDRTNTNDLGLTFSGLDFSFTDVDMAGMNDIINNIKAAAIDPNIRGIFLELSSIGTSTANIEEIRNQLIEFKKSGKFILSYAEAYSQSAYYLASVSDKIYMLPDGMLDIHGMASQSMFYKHLLEKLDIEMQIIRPDNNKFKSAVEPYFLDKMSEANREQNSVLLNSIWSKICDDISSARNIKVETINELADDMTLMFDTQAAIDNNFIDGLRYRDEIIAELKQLAEVADSKKVNIVKNTQYAKVRPELYEGKDNIAIVYASGQIIDGEGDESTIGSITLSEALRQAREDKKVKAIVMRVNSPGGSAVASEVIRREVELAAKEKPLIVSMGNYAASGGYWISSSSDYIFADPTTLTGSIGVFGTVPNLKGFFNDKLGLTFDEVKTNENSDFGSIAKPLTPYQMKMMQKHVTDTYDDFITLVSTERELRKTFVDSIAQGRVWSGDDAIELGLVDELGGIEEAVAYAAKKADLESYSIKEYPKQEDILESLLKTETQEYYTKSVKESFGNTYQYLKAIEMINRIEGTQALMPITIVE
ncbi:MAG: signal peptide peptidase SppA [Lentimicrobiaceae bacterium]|nr:signal peptide peptidase SppA [Lentimicrobiaceae bacterium]